jgi:hypothetical protein
MERSILLAIPLAAGCCPSNGDSAAQISYVLPTDLGVSIDDAGCAALCRSIAQQHYRVTGNISECTASVVDAGVAHVSCTVPVSTCVGGRRPAGFEALALSAHNAIGEWVARAAALETASVTAFQILASELRFHGAPEALVRAAQVAAEEETRHATMMRQLGRRFGATAIPVALAPRAARPLAEIALENAVEGQVREAFGALLAVEQAEAARDREVRIAFGLIAPEELGHAQLSVAIAEWADPRLSRTERRRVSEARAIALAQLASDVASETPREVRTFLGLPDATRAQDLLASM